MIQPVGDEKEGVGDQKQATKPQWHPFLTSVSPIDREHEEAYSHYQRRDGKRVLFITLFRKDARIEQGGDRLSKPIECRQDRSHPGTRSGEVQDGRHHDALRLKNPTGPNHDLIGHQQQEVMTVVGHTPGLFTTDLHRVASIFFDDRMSFRRVGHGASIGTPAHFK